MYVPHAPPISSSLMWSPKYYSLRKTILSLLVTQFPPLSCYVLPFAPKHLPQHPFSNTLSIWSSLIVTDQVLHSHKATDELKLHSQIPKRKTKDVGRMVAVFPGFNPNTARHSGQNLASTLVPMRSASARKFQRNQTLSVKLKDTQVYSPGKCNAV